MRLSSTSAYRVKRRIAQFSDAWDVALEYRMPALERAAYQRAVEGWLEPVVYKGEVVAQRRRYSDAMLRLLLQREDARPAPVLPAAKDDRRGKAEAELLRRLQAYRKRTEREERMEAIAFAERMTAEGKAP